MLNLFFLTKWQLFFNSLLMNQRISSVNKKFWVYSLFSFKLKLQKMNLLKIIDIFKNNHILDFVQLNDIVGIDLPAKTNRFKIVYLLTSQSLSKNLDLIVTLKESETIDSLNKFFFCSSWCEREIWDLLGIFFTNHNNLVRILTDYGFKWNPLRKDFPLTGFQQIRYNTQTNLIHSESVETTLL